MDPPSSPPHRQDDHPRSTSPWSAPTWTAPSSSSSGYRQPVLAPPLPARNAAVHPPAQPESHNILRDTLVHAGSSHRQLARPPHTEERSTLGLAEPSRDLERLRLDSPAGASVKGKERATFIDSKGDVLYWRTYLSEEDDMEDIMRLTEQELSEPYNIFTFRYFLHEWPHLTIMVFSSPESERAIATVIAKQESHSGNIRSTSRGYIAMLSVDRAWRRRGIVSATRLVQLVIDEMAHRGVDEVVLETEYDNISSLSLYESLGFIREKRLHRFYTNCKDAFRLVLPLNSNYSLEESPSEADMARWMVGTGPDETGPTVQEDRPPDSSRRSDTPLPSNPQQYDDLYT